MRGGEDEGELERSKDPPNDVVATKQKLNLRRGVSQARDADVLVLKHASPNGFSDATLVMFLAAVCLTNSNPQVLLLQARSGRREHVPQVVEPTHNQFIFDCGATFLLKGLASGTVGMAGMGRHNIGLPPQFAAAFSFSQICRLSNFWQRSPNNAASHQSGEHCFYVFPRWKSSEYLTAIKIIEKKQFQRLKINASIGFGGTKISSVNPYTVLESSIYKAFTLEFVKQTAARNITRVASEKPFGDACFSTKNVGVTRLGYAAPEIQLLLRSNDVVWRIFRAKLDGVHYMEDLLAELLVMAGMGRHNIGLPPQFAAAFSFSQKFAVCLTFGKGLQTMPLLINPVSTASTFSQAARNITRVASEKPFGDACFSTKNVGVTRLGYAAPEIQLLLRSNDVVWRIFRANSMQKTNLPSSTQPSSTNEHLSSPLPSSSTSVVENSGWTATKTTSLPLTNLIVVTTPSAHASAPPPAAHVSLLPDLAVVTTLAAALQITNFIFDCGATFLLKGLASGTVGMAGMGRHNIGLPPQFAAAFSFSQKFAVCLTSGKGLQRIPLLINPVSTASAFSQAARNITRVASEKPFGDACFSTKNVGVTRLGYAAPEIQLLLRSNDVVWRIFRANSMQKTNLPSSTQPSSTNEHLSSPLPSSSTSVVENSGWTATKTTSLPLTNLIVVTTPSAHASAPPPAAHVSLLPDLAVVTTLAAALQITNFIFDCGATFLLKGLASGTVGMAGMGRHNIGLPPQFAAAFSFSQKFAVCLTSGKGLQRMPLLINPVSTASAFSQAARNITRVASEKPFGDACFSTKNVGVTRLGYAAPEIQLLLRSNDVVWRIFRANSMQKTNLPSSTQPSSTNEHLSSPLPSSSTSVVENSGWTATKTTSLPLTNLIVVTTPSAHASAPPPAAHVSLLPNLAVVTTLAAALQITNFIFDCGATFLLKGLASGTVGMAGMGRHNIGLPPQFAAAFSFSQKFAVCLTSGKGLQTMPLLINPVSTASAFSQAARNITRVASEKPFGDACFSTKNVGVTGLGYAAPEIQLLLRSNDVVWRIFRANSMQKTNLPSSTQPSSTNEHLSSPLPSSSTSVVENSGWTATKTTSLPLTNLIVVTTPSAHASAPPPAAHVSFLPDLAVVTTLAAALQITNFIFDCGATFLLKGLASGTVGMAGMGRHNIGLPPQFAAAFSFSQKFAVCLTSGKGLQTMPLLINPVSTASAFSQAARNITRVASEKPFGDACFSTKNVGVTRLGYAAPEIQLLLRSNDVVWRIFRANSMQKTNLPSSTQPSSTNEHLSSPLPSSSTSVVENSGWTATKTTSLPLTNLIVVTTPSAHASAPPPTAHVSLLPNLAVVTTLAAALQITNFIFDCGATFLLKGLASGTVGMAGMGRHNIGLPPQFAAAFSFSQKFAVCLTSGKGLQTMPLLINPVSTASAFSQAARNITRVASEKPFGDACFSTKNVGVTRLGYAAPEIQLLLRSNDVVWRIFRANSMQKTNLPSSTQPSSTNEHLSSPLPSSSTSVVENSGWTATKTTSLPLTNLIVVTTPSAHASAPPPTAHVSLLPDLAVVTTLAAALQITNFIFDCGATFLLKGLASGTVGMAGMGRHNIGLPPQFAAAFSFSQKFAVCLTSGKGLQTMPLLINPVSTASAFSQAARNITRVASEKPFGDACFSTKNVGVTRLGYAAPEIQLLLRSNDVVWRIFRANSMQKTNLPSSTQPSSTNEHLSSPLPSSSTSVVENSGWTATKTTSLPLTNLIVVTTPSAHASAPPPTAHVSLLPDLAVVTTLAAALQITNFIFDCGATFLLKGLASGTVGMAGMGRHNIGLPPQFAAAFSFSQKFAVCLTSGKGLQTMPLLINPVSTASAFSQAARNITRVASEKPFGDACFSTKNVGVTRLGYAAPEIQLLLRSNDVVWRIFRANSMVYKLIVPFLFSSSSHPNHLLNHISVRKLSFSQYQKTNLPSSTQPSSTNEHLSSPLPSSSTSVVENSGWTATKTTSLPLNNLIVITNFIFDCGATFLLKGLASGTVGMAGMGRHNIGLPPQFAAAFSFSQKFAVCLTSGKGLQTMPLLINLVSTASAFSQAARNITRVASEKPFGDACFSTRNVGVTRLGYAAPEIQLLLRSNDVVWRIFRANSMVSVSDDVICLGFVDGVNLCGVHIDCTVLVLFIFSPSSSAQPSFRPKALLLPVAKDQSTLQYTTVINQHIPLVPASVVFDLGGRELWVDCDKDYVSSTYQSPRCNYAKCSRITNFIFDCGATFLLKGLASGTVGMAGMGRHNIGLPPQFAAAFSFSQKFAVCLTSGKGLQTMPLLINPVSTASAFSQAARNITRVASEKPFGDACFSTKNVGVTRLGYAAPEIQLLLRSNDVVWRIFRANSMVYKLIVPFLFSSSSHPNHLLNHISVRKLSFSQYQKTNLPSSTQPSSTNEHLSSPLPSSSTSVVENSGWTATKTTSLPLNNLIVITNFIFDCGATFLLKGLASGTVGMAGMGRHNIGLPPQFAAAFSFSQKFAVCLTSGKGLQTMPLLINLVSTASAFSQAARNITRVASEKPFGDACFSTRNVGVTRLGYAAPEIQLLLRSNDVVWRIFRANSMVSVSDDVICLGFVDGVNLCGVHIDCTVLVLFIFSPSSSAQPSFRPKALLLPVAKDQSTLQYTTVINQHIPLVPASVVFDLGGRELWVDCDKDYVSSTYQSPRCNYAKCSRITNFIFDCGATFLLKGLASGTVGMAGMGRHNIGLPPQFAAAFSFSRKLAVCLTFGKGLQTMPLLMNPVSTASAFSQAARNITRVASEKPFGDACFSTENVGVTRLRYAVPEIQLLLHSNDVVWKIFRANSMQKTNLPSSTQPSSTNAHLSSPLPSSSTSVVENSGWTATKTTSLPLTNLVVATTPSAHAPAPPAVAHVSLLDLAVVTTLAAALQITNFIFDCGATFLLKGLANGTVGMAGMGRHNIGLPPQFAATFSFSQKFAVCLNSGKGLQTMPLLIKPVSTASAFSQAARNITRVASEKPFGDACFSTKNVGVTRLGYAAPEIQLLLRSNDVVWRIFRANSMFSSSSHPKSSAQPSFRPKALLLPVAKDQSTLQYTTVINQHIPLVPASVVFDLGGRELLVDCDKDYVSSTYQSPRCNYAKCSRITNFIFDCGATFLLKGLASGTVGMAGMGRHNIGLPPQFAAAFSFSRKLAVCLTFGKGLQTMPLLMNPVSTASAFSQAARNITRVASEKPFGDACLSTKNVGVTRLGYAVPEIQLLLHSNDVVWRIFRANSMVSVSDDVICLGFVDGINLNVAKDQSTLQYTTVINQRTPLVPASVVFDLGGRELWVDCDKDYVSSTYQSPRCNYAKCSRAGSTTCGTCFSPPRPGCRLASGTVGMPGMGRHNIGLPPQFAAVFSFSQKFAVCLTSGKGLQTMPLLINPVSTASAFSQAARNITRVASEKPFGDACFSTKNVGVTCLGYAAPEIQLLLRSNDVVWRIFRANSMVSVSDDVICLGFVDGINLTGVHIDCTVLVLFIFSPSSSAQPSFRPKALLLPVAKDQSTLQYTTVINQHIPLVPASVVFDLGGRELWVDCDKDYVSSTYQSHRCNYAKCSRITNFIFDCGATFLLKGLASGTVGMAGMGRHNIGLPPQFAAAFSFSRKLAVCLTFGKGLQTMPLLMNPVSTASAFSQAARNITRVASEKPFGDACFSTKNVGVTRLGYAVLEIQLLLHSNDVVWGIFRANSMVSVSDDVICLGFVDGINLNVAKDQSTLQYTTVINQRTPLVPASVVFDLGGRELWVDCDKDYVSSTYQSPRCNYAKCSRAGSTSCGTCFSSPRPGCRLASGTVGMPRMGRHNIGLPPQFAAVFSFSQKFAVCLTSGKGLQTMPLLINPVSTASAFSQAARNITRVASEKPFGDACFSTKNVGVTCLGYAAPEIQLLLRSNDVVWRIFRANSMVSVSDDVICLGFVDGINLTVAKDQSTLQYTTVINQRTPLVLASVVFDLGGRELWVDCDKDNVSSTYQSPRCNYAKCSRVGSTTCGTCFSPPRPGCRLASGTVGMAGMGRHNIGLPPQFAAAFSFSRKLAVCLTFDKGLQTMPLLINPVSTASAFSQAARNITRVASEKPFGDACFSTKNVGVTRLGYAVPEIQLLLHSNDVVWRIFRANSMVSVSDDVICLGFVDGINLNGVHIDCTVLVLFIFSPSSSAQPSFRPKALLLPVAKDQSTLQYTTVINQHIPLVPASVVFDLGGRELWVDCDKDYVSSTYQSPRCNYAKCSRITNFIFDCGATFLLKGLASGTVGMAGMGRHNIGLPPQFAAAFSFSRKLAVCLTFGKGLQTMPLLMNPVSTASAFSQAARNITRVASEKPFGDACFSTKNVGVTRLGYAVPEIQLLLHSNDVVWRIFRANSMQKTNIPSSTQPSSSNAHLSSPLPSSSTSVVENSGWTATKTMSLPLTNLLVATTPSAHAPAPPAVAHVSLLLDLAVVTILVAKLQITNFIFDCGATFLLKGLASGTVGMAGMGRHNIGLPPQFAAAFSFSQKFEVCLTSGKGLQTMPLLINPVSTASAFSQAARNITRVASEKPFGDACFSTKNVGVTHMGYAVPEIQLLLHSNDVVWRIFRANSMQKTNIPSSTQPSSSNAHLSSPLPSSSTSVVENSGWTATKTMSLPLTNLLVATTPSAHAPAPPAVAHVSLLLDLAVVTTLVAKLQITNFIFDCGATFLLKGLASGTVGMAGMGCHNIGLPPQFAAAFSFSQKFEVCLTSGKGLQTMPLLINPVSTASAFSQAARNITREASEKPFGDACFSTKNVGVTRLGYAAPKIQLLLRSNDVFWRIFRANSMVSVSDDVSCLGFVDGVNLCGVHIDCTVLVLFIFSPSSSAQPSFRPKALLLPEAKDQSTLQYTTIINQHIPLVPASVVFDLGGRELWVDCDKDYVSSTYQSPRCNYAECSRAGSTSCGTCFSPPRPGCRLASGTVGMAGMGRYNIGLPPQFTAAFSFSQKFAVCLSSDKGLQTMPLLINPVSTASAFSQAARNITRVASEKPFGDACFSTKNVAVTRLGYAMPEIQLLLHSNDVVWRIFRANSMVYSTWRYVWDPVPDVSASGDHGHTSWLIGPSVLKTNAPSVSWLTIKPSAYRTIHVSDPVVYHYDRPRFTNRLPVRSMVVGKAFGLSIHPCDPNDTIITPKGPWIHPSDYRRLAHEIIRPSAFGLLAGPTSVLSTGSHRGLSRWLSVESPLVLPIPNRFHHWSWRLIHKGGRDIRSLHDLRYVPSVIPPIGTIDQSADLSLDPFIRPYTYPVIRRSDLLTQRSIRLSRSVDPSVQRSIRIRLLLRSDPSVRRSVSPIRSVQRSVQSDPSLRRSVHPIHPSIHSIEPLDREVACASVRSRLRESILIPEILAEPHPLSDQHFVECFGTPFWVVMVILKCVRMIPMPLDVLPYIGAEWVTARPYTSSSRATTVHQLECQLTGPPSWVSTRSVHRARLSCRSAHLAELASPPAGLAHLAELASSSSSFSSPSWFSSNVLPRSFRLSLSVRFLGLDYAIPNPSMIISPRSLDYPDVV
ncbi:Aspartic peptidase domain superfamily [Arabidopsis suecica]|uniref:Aspartic peptidase domain superfamily n=1 Tax=Arabidopsis suecica TaxID=45249 RepID=A0A8T2BQE7_ARASU|nr:Aspartic peptidase domain superfamily [Arabidopsis suecica]